MKIVLVCLDSFLIYSLSLEIYNNLKGSATACILGIDCQLGRIYSVNIGDSGYVILRQGCVIYRSQSQEMNGDCPRQLDVYPWTSSLKHLGLNYTQISYVFQTILYKIKKDGYQFHSGF
jgi:hypothetical protein